MTAAKNPGMRDSMPSAPVVAGDALDQLGPEPPPDQSRQRTAWQLRVAAQACRTMGSALYGRLLQHAATDCEAAGPTWAVLADHAAPGRADALALRLMAAVHRLVLEGRAPQLAAFYPSVGGTAPGELAWNAFRQTLSTARAEIAPLLEAPCQTNEVGRSAGLAVGFLAVVAQTGLPLRLREVGASAGLNLRCDHFLIGGGGARIGDPASPVDLSAHWRRPPPLHGAMTLPVVDRRGCDVAPVDPTTTEGQLTLTASVWADQVSRLQRLRGALALARAVPAAVDAMPLDQWTAQQTSQLPLGQATVVYHSVVSEYVDAPTRERFEQAMRSAGDRASIANPLAWVRLEPISQQRQHWLQLTMWPGGHTQTLARCGAHGTDVEWLGNDNRAGER